MGVYIKNMEMPSEQYGKMVITLYPNGHVAEYVGDIGRVWEAVSVPPHGRLIDADALTQRFFQVPYVCNALSFAPTIIEAEGEDDTI